MVATSILDTLSSEDHQAALKIIYQLGECQTQNQLNHILKTTLIPLVRSNGVFYARLEGEQNNPCLLDAIYPPTLCQCRWDQFIKAAAQISTSDSPPAKERNKPIATGAFCCDNQACTQCSTESNNPSKNDHRYCAILALIDSQIPSVALYFCLYSPQPNNYSTRDIKLLHLLRATLLQTLKVIIYQEQCQNLQHELDCSFVDAEPLAMLREDGELVFKNHAFDEALGHSNCPPLSTFLSSRMKPKSGNIGFNYTQSQIGQHWYDVNVTPISTSAFGKASLYMLRFTRVEDKKIHIISQLEKVGLTNRELEIAVLIYHGLSSHNIASQLNLSYHTVRDHIKHIYSKMGVSTRGEMLMWSG